LNGYDNDNPYDIPEEEIGLYVQEALDELEFILGDVHSKYGALRASLGHPRPWKLNYVEVRSSLFTDICLKAKAKYALW
jgi:alpha-N-arabinofuranosidase